MPVSPRYCAGAALWAAAVTAVADTGVQFPVFDAADLVAGRAVWTENCMGCHAHGVADAPRPDTYSEWEARIRQPREVLYTHAIEGFFGPDYAMMPPRGGNPALSDTEVRQAVDYMVRLVEHFNAQDKH